MMIRKFRSLLATTGLLAGVLAGGIGAAAPASASASCPSGAVLSWTYPFYDSSGRPASTGHIFQYQNGACAYLEAQGVYSGMYKWMDIQIKDVYSTGQTGYDAGHFLYYAGPVSIYPGNGNCLEVWFDMQNSAGTYVTKTTEFTNCD
ncbi:hypothetical protein ABT095_00990 [Kitasatospora sp. NPDC002227]|uniref:hypothetical protein n=1 Tax=Kitasatospora sp. NPDC002227 TaxID=3154773 RepID=UPI00331E3C95